MTPALPRLLAVVVTYRSADIVGECLRALPAALGPHIDYRTVVVDNASGDRSLEAAAEADPEAQLISLGRNAGYAAAINAAVEEAFDPEMEAVLVLNPDIRLSPCAVGPLREALDDPSVGIAVPRLFDAVGVPQHSLRREPTVLRAFGEAVLGGERAGRCAPFGEVVSEDGSYGAAYRPDWATGAAMLIHRRCIERVGPWDESYFLYSEETDYCLRARDVGLAVEYRPEARATHLGGESRTSPELWSVLTRNRVRLYRSRHGPVRSMAFRAAVLLNESIRALGGRPTSRAALRALFTPAEPTVGSGPAPIGPAGTPRVDSVTDPALRGGPRDVHLASTERHPRE
ncbi:MAG: glycosyltransferase [Microthrixaceae bacterium]